MCSYKYVAWCGSMHCSTRPSCDATSWQQLQICEFARSGYMIWRHWKAPFRQLASFLAWSRVRPGCHNSAHTPESHKLEMLNARISSALHPAFGIRNYCWIVSVTSQEVSTTSKRVKFRLYVWAKGTGQMRREFICIYKKKRLSNGWAIPKSWQLDKVFRPKTWIVVPESPLDGHPKLVWLIICYEIL